MVIKLSKQADFLGSRTVGEKIRSEIENVLTKGENVELDFTGIDIVTQSFADECFGKLAIKIGLEEYKKRISLKSVTKEIQAILDYVVANRLEKGQVESA